MSIEKAVSSAILLIFVSSCTTTTQAQNDQAATVRRAVQCLSAKSFLPPKTDERKLGYLFDRNSYPSQLVLYIVDWPTTTLTSGFAFTVVVDESDGAQSFDIQNNAKFKLSGSRRGEISFPEPPLGGVWTQERLTDAIKRIVGSHLRVRLQAKDLQATTSLNCEAYTDPQPMK